MANRRRLVQVRLYQKKYWVVATSEGEARAARVPAPPRVYEDAPIVIQGMHDTPGRWLWVTVRAAKKLGLTVAPLPGEARNSKPLRFDPLQRTPY